MLHRLEIYKESYSSVKDKDSGFNILPVSPLPLRWWDIKGLLQYVLSLLT